MATTISNLVASMNLARQSVNGKDGSGLKAKLAASVAVLGCTAALALGGLRSGEATQAPSAAPAVTAAQANGRARQLFLEWNTILLAGSTTTSSNAEQFTYGEDRYGAVEMPTAPTDRGPQEYLTGDDPTAVGSNTPVPTFGPQP